MMSEKRFFIDKIDTNQYAVYDRLKIGYIKPLVYTDRTVSLNYTQSVCDLLNNCDAKMNEVYEKLIIGKGSSEVIDMIKYGDNLHGVAIKELFDRNKKLEEENEQLRNYNKQLKGRLEKINKGYGHLTHRNGLTANEWLIESQERELKKKNEQISDWIEQHGKDIVKIGEQQAIISALKKEIKELKEKLDDVLELTEFVGMTSLRKAEIKSIVNR